MLPLQYSTQPSARISIRRDADVLRARGRIRILLVSALSSTEAGWLYRTLVDAMTAAPAS